MSLKSRFGLDGFDLFVHLVVTACIFFAMAVSGAEEELFGVVAVSLIVLAIRRRQALRRGIEPAEADARIEFLEQRVAELEAGHERMMELEERLDFAERLLTREPDARKLGQGS